MPTTEPKDQSKLAIVIGLLNRSKSASFDEICKATKWQKHCARAFLTGLRTKGPVIIREHHGEEGTVYRISQTADQNSGAEAS